jgi:hypothetical protein
VLDFLIEPSEVYDIKNVVNSALTSYSLDFGTSSITNYA